MKVKAHPMMVAVALGLLGPAALAADEDKTSRAVEGVKNTLATPERAVGESEVAASVTPHAEDPHWTRLELYEDEGGMPSISPSDWEASESAWEQARLTI